MTHLSTWGTDDWAAVAGTASVLVAAAIGFRRRVIPWWRRVSGKFDAITETLVGREAIHDAATGKELVPAQPGLGVRIATLEEGFSELAKQSHRMDTLERQMMQQGEQLQLHATEIAALKRAETERIVTRAESAQMWRAVADGDPDLAPPPPADPDAPDAN